MIRFWKQDSVEITKNYVYQIITATIKLDITEYCVNNVIMKKVSSKMFLIICVKSARMSG